VTSIAPHAHYAIQLVMGAPTGLRVQFGRRGEWQPCAAALVPARAVHTIDVRECDISVVLFIEPETPEGKALSARLQSGLELLDADIAMVFTKRLERAWRIEKSYDAVKAVCMQLVRELSGTAPRESPSDPRVLATLETIRQRVDQTVSLPEVAKLANLSPGRFRHLFVEQTGMPLRTYVLWRQMLHVWTLLTQGETLVSSGPSSRVCRFRAPLAHLPHDVRVAAFGAEDEWAAESKSPISLSRIS